MARPSWYVALGMQSASQARPACHRGVLVDMALLAPALMIALWVPRAFDAHWANWVLPSAALLATSGTWFWIRSSQYWGHGLGQIGSRRGNAQNRVGLGIVGIFVSMLVLAACYWPASRTLGTPPPPLELTAVILLVPLAEELYFRGAWLAALRAELGVFTSTFVVSIVFGLLHRGQGQFLPMLLASCALCALTLWTRTIVWAVAIHAIWNALTLVVRLRPDAGRIGLAAAVTAVTLVAIVWQLSRAHRNES